MFCRKSALETVETCSICYPVAQKSSAEKLPPVHILVPAEHLGHPLALAQHLGPLQLCDATSLAASKGGPNNVAIPVAICV